MANSGVNIDAVVDIEVDDEVIYKRMSGRRVCSRCGRTYNVNLGVNPKYEGICDDCQSALVQRVDDKLECEKAKVTYPNGNVLECGFKDGKRNGEFTITTKDEEEVYTGTFEDDVPTGEATYTKKD